MRYLLLIYGNEQAAAAKTPEAQAAEMDAWWKYTADLQESGQYVGGEAVQVDMTSQPQVYIPAKNPGVAVLLSFSFQAQAASTQVRQLQVWCC